MRADQRIRLQELSEKLCDIVLADADPENWSGQGKRPKDMTKEERGDDFWCRRQASASLVLLLQVVRLVDVGWMQELSPQAEEPELDATIARAEKEATRLLNRLAAKQQG